MQDEIDEAMQVETLHAQHGTPNAPNAPTRKKRSDADTKRESLFVYPSAAMRLDLQHTEARDMLAAWLRAQVGDETAERVGSVMGELIAHIDRLRKGQK